MKVVGRRHLGDSAAPLPPAEALRRAVVLQAQLEDGPAAELTPKDLTENGVVKVADAVEVDVTTRAWEMTIPEVGGDGR